MTVSNSIISATTSSDVGERGNNLFKVLARLLRNIGDRAADRKSPAKLPGRLRRGTLSMSGYLAADFFEVLLDDFRAADFFVPALLEREALDFLAPDFEELERAFDDDLLVVAGFSHYRVLSFSAQRARETHLPSENDEIISRCL
jgi:hypothetical protein